MSNSENLPTKNGFDDTSDNKLMRGDRLKFVETSHKRADGSPAPDGEVIGLDIIKVVTRFQDKKLLDQIVEKPGDEALDLDEMNRAIPQKEWSKGLDGKPQPPWCRQYFLYLLRESDAAEFTWITGSIGGGIAIRELRNKVSTMRKLRGTDVFPVLELAACPWRTSYGLRTRPDFKVVRWVSFGGGSEPALLPAPDKNGGPAAPEKGKVARASLKEVKAAALAEEMGDEIPKDFR